MSIKKRTTLRELVGWGIIWAMPERKHSFLREVFLEAPTFHLKVKGAKGASEISTIM